VPITSKATVAGPDLDPGVLYSYSFDQEGALTKGDAAWTWLGHALADMRGRRRIENRSDLPEFVRDTLLADNEELLVIWRDGWMFGVLPDFRHRTFNADDETGRLRFAFDDRQMLTARRQPLQTVDDIRQKIEKTEKRFANPLEVFEAIIYRLLTHLSAALLANGPVLDKIEDRIVSEKWRGERERLSAVRRNIVVGQRILAGLNMMFARFETDSLGPPPNVTDVMEDLGRRSRSLLHDSEQLQARARVLQDEMMALLSEQSNQLLYTLSVLTAVMMPATIVTGLFGMNLDGMPLAGTPFGFGAAFVLSALASAVVYFIVRRRDQ